MAGQWYERLVFSPLLSIADRALSQVRSELLGQARGRVLELGIGSGLSLSSYPRGLTEIVGLEPSAGLLSQCRKRLGDAPDGVPVQLVQGSAERLPWADDSFDTVVAFLVFCTIPDASAAAREINRVLKPDGQLLFFEHVAAKEPRLARWQSRINPLWKHLACGCQLNRDTHAVFQGAGFDMSQVDVRRHPDIPLPLVAPTISGVARHG